MSLTFSVYCKMLPSCHPLPYCKGCPLLGLLPGETVACRISSESPFSQPLTGIRFNPVYSTVTLMIVGCRLPCCCDCCLVTRTIWLLHNFRPQVLHWQFQCQYIADLVTYHETIVPNYSEHLISIIFITIRYCLTTTDMT